jgi:dipeptidase E
MIHLLMSETTDSSQVEVKFFKKIGNIPQKIAYIPSKTDFNRKYFKIFQKHYVDLGIKDFCYCDFDQEFAPTSWNILNDADAIYLSGGFTPDFLQNLRSRGVLEQLIKLSLSKPIIGVSAGALIMGKDISILFDDAREGEAAKALQNCNGLNLYPFEFSPHFVKSEIDHLKARSLIVNKAIIACDDISGLILNKKIIEVAGIAHIFQNGTYRTSQDEIVSPTLIR